MLSQLKCALPNSTLVLSLKVWCGEDLFHRSDKKRKFSSYPLKGIGFFIEMIFTVGHCKVIGGGLHGNLMTEVLALHALRFHMGTGACPRCPIFPPAPCL